MARNSGGLGYNMEGNSQPHIQWDHTVGQGSAGELSSSRGQNTVQEVRDPSISRSTSSKRSFRQGFLNWVAFERSLSPNISDLVKRTCPLAECEKCLGSELQMRQHLKGCLHLEKGFYRCHETDKIERIGKCETKGCRELQQYKSLFSNAMHTLGRRLSPRGCRPSRLVNKISKKYSKSPHMFGVDPRIPYLDLDWESTTGNSDALSEYTSFDSEWTQPYVAELGSDCEVVELPAQHGFAELYNEYATMTPEYSEQPQLHISELGVAIDDSTQVSQFLAHGTYQPAELSAITDYVFERQNDNTGQNIPVDGWDLTPSNYDTTSEDLLNMYCSNNDLSMTDSPPIDAPCQQIPQTSNVAQSYDCIELVSPVEQGDWNVRYSSTCNVSPVGSFTDSDVSQGNSVFSASPSRSTSGTSVLSIDSIETPPDSTPAPSIFFFDEPGRMCQDPDEGIEPHEATTDLMNNLHASFHLFKEPARVYEEPIKEELYLGEAMPIFTNKTISSALASPWSSSSFRSNPTTDQSISSSPSHFSGKLHEEFQTRYQPQLRSKTELPSQQPMSMPQRQIRRKPVASSSLGNEPPVQRLSPDIDYSTKVAAPAQPSGKPTPYQCEYCPQLFTDKSNLKRHIRYSCKKRPGYTPDKDKRPFKCNFGNCQKRFTQRYNLFQHQKTQGHLLPARIASLHQPPLQIIHHSLGTQQVQAYP